VNNYAHEVQSATTFYATFEIDKNEIKIVNIEPFNIGFASKVTTKQKGN
jgi:hypothetical protein